MKLLDRIKKVFPHALPVMLGYLAIGLAAGILENKVGFTPLEAFVFSIAFYTGSGQFMIPSLWMAGVSLPAIIASVSLVSARQVLYSAAFSPYFAKTNKLLAFLFSATVTDESFGVNLDRFDNDPSWTEEDAYALNLLCRFAWASSNLVGCAVGGVIEVPLAILSFAMTSIFICLLLARKFDSTAVATCASAVAGVLIAKIAGLAGVEIILGACMGIACGLVFEQVRDR